MNNPKITNPVRSPLPPEAPRTEPARNTSWRLTPADEAALAEIATALRAEGRAAFPSRAAAVRYAIQAATAHLHRTGHLPPNGLQSTAP